MTLSQIECFVLAAQTGTISAAAERLFISQQAASSHIRSLERELGFPLFERTSKGSSLTREGRILLDAWKPALEAVKSSIESARASFAERERELRVALADMGSCSEDITLALADYEREHEGLHVACQITSPRRMLRGFDEDAINMAILYDSELSGETSLRHTRLHEHALRGFVYVAATHPLAQATTISADELRHETIGVLDSETSMGFEQIVRLYFHANGVPQPQHVQRYDSRRSLEIALVTGRCVTIAFESTFAQDETRFRAIEIDTQGHDFWISLFWKREGLDATAMALAQLLREHLGGAFGM